MYDGHANQGMRGIKLLLQRAGLENITEYDVRSKAEVPNMSYDTYISTGGPGNPNEGDGIWDIKWYNWLQAVWDYNQNADNEAKKQVLLICHSFQMACIGFGIGEVNLRRTPSFGVLPCHKTEEGESEPFLMALPEPFYITDNRKWQVVNSNWQKMTAMGAEILALEKIRPHVDLPQAIMAIRFSEDIFGTQFHPEADPEGMLVHFQDATKKAEVIEGYGEDKYYEMMDRLNDEDKIILTFKSIVPAFLEEAKRKFLK